MRGERRRLVPRWCDKSVDCYSKDKLSHQSKLKSPLGLKWHFVQASEYERMCVSLLACKYAVTPTTKVNADGWMALVT